MTPNTHGLMSKNCRAISIFVALFSIFFAMSMQSAQACRCAAPSLQEGLNNFNEMLFVFKGEVISTSPSAMGRGPMVKFKILNQIKGPFEDDDEDMNFFYNPNTAACGSSFYIGQVVIIGAYNEGRGQARVAHNCAQEGIRFYLDSKSTKPMNIFEEQE